MLYYDMEHGICRDAFPVLQCEMYRAGERKRYAYLDSAATALKPVVLAEAVDRYYRTNGASVHRGMYRMSQQATDNFEAAREKAREYFGADERYEVVFTKGATEAINIIASGLESFINEGDEIVLTEMEHHANVVPWQELARRTGARVRPVAVDKRADLPNLEEIEANITDRARLVTTTAMSNVTGWMPNVRALVTRAHAHGALTLVDGAQYSAHSAVNVGRLDCDFFACSAHKFCGPTGLGILIGKREYVERMRPFIYGGNMIREVYIDHSVYRSGFDRFEAGTPHIAGVIALAAVLDWLTEFDRQELIDHEKKLTEYAYQRLAACRGIRIYGDPMGRETTSRAIIPFNVGDAHAHDVASILDEEGVAIRAGHHCAQPFHRAMGIDSTARLSFHFYNSTEDIDQCMVGIHRALKIFGID